jgi:uncharacterized protein (DUF1330 family)
MAAYAIVDVEIFDIADYLQYQQALRPLLADAGAHYLARGGEIEVIEGDCSPQRLILVEFPSMEALTDFYHSDAYQELAKQRRACSRTTMVAVRGVEDALPPQD